VGYYTVTIVAGADNVLSLPMIRDAVFAGTVASGAGAVTASGFTAVAGTSSPGWTAHQWQYTQGTQSLTYYAEFTSGALKGLYYRIVDNDATTLTLDTEGDSLLLHPLSGAPNAALVSGDSFKIRPYWRIADVFESGGTPILKPRVSPIDQTADSILFPTYPVAGDGSTVGTDKSASLEVYYLNGTGWKAIGQTGSYADQVLRPNEAVVIRRRGATNLTLTNLGSVLMNRGVYFFTGGNGTVGNDTYFSISRPAAVSLDNSGLRTADQTTSPIKDTPTPLGAGHFDCILAFDDPAQNAGYNLSNSHTYYYLANTGWKEVGNPSSTIGADVLLQPGKAYILRKYVSNPGKDWVNDANY
jgi:uncharacterized protein (TIGR02597 family)